MKVRKLICLSCHNDEKLFGDVMAGFNIANIIWFIECAVQNALNIEFISAAAWTNGAKKLSRIIWLSFHVLLILVLLCSLCQVMMM